ncbi:MAG: IS1595 family transposase [Anaerolineales bacterium]|nr:MAG: IS1595 family transposase [Anaerolineales bacterium]
MEDPGHPVAGIDYPRTFQEFDEWFSSDDACIDYIAKIRWRNGFCCPSCGDITEEPSLTGRGLFLCRKCKRQTSITSGTLFHKTRKPLRTWFFAMWFVTSQKHGASALGLQRVLGLGSYNTAWTWLHKLRRAMVRLGRDQLTGEVEVDETYVGGVGVKVRGRGARGKAIVAIAAEVRGRGPGRIRMSVVPDVSAISLHEFVLNNVAKGAEIRTDGWKGYRGIAALGYTHIVTNISDSGNPAHVVMPRVHRVASLLDRWWLGIHQGAIRPVHLDYYLDEFTFRFNRRTSKARGLLFYRLMEQAIECDPVSRQMIVEGHSPHK